jgi:hypothetical protein
MLRAVVDAADSEGWRVVGLLRFWSPVPTIVQNYLFGLTGTRLWAVRRPRILFKSLRRAVKQHAYFGLR